MKKAIVFVIIVILLTSVVIASQVNKFIQARPYISEQDNFTFIMGRPYIYVNLTSAEPETPSVFTVNSMEPVNDTATTDTTPC